MQKTSSIIKMLLDCLSFIIFLPVFIICQLYALCYGLFNMKHDFECGMEFIYNVTSLLYCILLILIIVFLVRG